jgi:Mrp family chromosome partitioning ATPase
VTSTPPAHKKITKPWSNIKNIIIVSTAKGGVGKTTLSCLIALMLKQMKYNIAMIDGDVMGPSLPSALKVHGKVTAGKKTGIIPPRTHDGISVFSSEQLFTNKSVPVIWHDEKIQKFIEDHLRLCNFQEDIDFLIIDAPPSTGAVPKAVVRFARMNKIKHGFVFVSEPDDLSINSTSKAVSMAKVYKSPIIGMIENKLNGESRLCEYCDKNNIPFLGSIPYTEQLKITHGNCLNMSSLIHVDESLEPIVARIRLFFMR